MALVEVGDGSKKPGCAATPHCPLDDSTNCEKRADAGCWWLCLKVFGCRTASFHRKGDKQRLRRPDIIQHNRPHSSRHLTKVDFLLVRDLRNSKEDRRQKERRVDPLLLVKCPPPHSSPHFLRRTKERCRLICSPNSIRSRNYAICRQRTRRMRLMRHAAPKGKGRRRTKL